MKLTQSYQVVYRDAVNSLTDRTYRDASQSVYFLYDFTFNHYNIGFGKFRMKEWSSSFDLAATRSMQIPSQLTPLSTAGALTAFWAMCKQINKVSDQNLGRFILEVGLHTMMVVPNIGPAASHALLNSLTRKIVELITAEYDYGGDSICTDRLGRLAAKARLPLFMPKAFDDVIDFMAGYCDEDN